MLKEFKEFALKGNLVDMAVGLTLGVPFGALAASFVADIFSPPLGMLVGGADFSALFAVLREGSVPGPYASIAAAKEAGAVTINYGLFINALINFFIIAFAMFMVVKAMNRLRRKEPVPQPGPTPDQKLLMEIRDALKRP